MNGMDAPGRADLHVHPHGDRRAPHDGTGVLEALAAGDLDVVAFTDHDNVETGRRLAGLAVSLGLATEVVVGAEISTAAGHVLGLWLTAAVPSRRPIGETIERIHDQGGMAVVAHPLLPIRISVPGRTLRALADGPRAARPDAIEGFNGLAAWVPFYGASLRRLAEQTGLPLVAGSDAHRPGQLGRGRTLFPGRRAAELRQSIAAGTTGLEGDGQRPASVLQAAIWQVPELRARR